MFKSDVSVFRNSLVLSVGFFGSGWHKPVIDLLGTKIRFELDGVLL